MEINNCTDINGLTLSDIKLNEDGTVIGVTVQDGDEIYTNLSYECCTVNGYYFDPTDTKCYWSENCLTGGEFNVILNPEGNSGTYFQVGDNEKDICYLELDFKFILKIDSKKIAIDGLRTFLEGINLNVSIKKNIYDETLPIPNNLEDIITKEIFNITDINEFFTDNINTGIFLTKDSVNFESIKLNLISSLTNQEIINENSLNSDWVHIKFIVDDEETLNKIFNENITISIVGNNLAEYSILLDDIKLNKVCKTPPQEPLFTEECPSFELSRVVDNKKSWVWNNKLTTREYGLHRRETKYPIKHEKLSINTKEVDLAINTTKVIENDVIRSIVTNDCLFAPKSNCINKTHECIDLTPLITTEIITSSDLNSILIDVKNRKTISSYPTLDLIYYRYLNADNHCGSGNTTNSLTLESMEKYVDVIGTYWVDLIEQLVPATTIWGSSQINTDVTTFSGNGGGSGTNKFIYKRGTLLLCDSIDYEVTNPVSNGVINAEVLIEDITDSSNIITNNCNTLFIKQMSRGSEFIGSVNVIGVGEAPLTGDTISITETIKDSCNLYQKC